MRRLVTGNTRRRTCCELDRGVFKKLLVIQSVRAAKRINNLPSQPELKELQFVGLHGLLEFIIFDERLTSSLFDLRFGCDCQKLVFKCDTMIHFQVFCGVNRNKTRRICKWKARCFIPSQLKSPVSVLEENIDHLQYQFNNQWVFV